MRMRGGLGGPAAVLLIAAGCQSEFTTVTVRFGQAPPPTVYVEGDASAQAHLAVHAGTPTAGDDLAALDTERVALWGGPHAGEDVTGLDVSLAPGHYTFVHDRSTADDTVWGTVRVNVAGDELIDVFRRWREEVPKQRRRLAYRFEVAGSARSCDQALFRTLERELAAVDRFDQALASAINREGLRRSEQQRRDAELASSAVVRLFDAPPGGSPTPSFSVFAGDDLERVYRGETLTKILLAADYESVCDKLDALGALIRDLRRCRDVARDEVRRLEGRKRLHAIVFNSDDAYVENRNRLQEALAQAEALTARLAELRDRQLTLAFAAELAAPVGTHGPLDEAMRDLDEDRAVLEVEGQRLDALFAEAGPKTHRRVALQERRQRLSRSLNDVRREREVLVDARDALEAMRRSATVVHRQGVYRILAAGFVDEHVSARLRNALAREALLTVRLQAAPKDAAAVEETLARR